MMLLPFSLAILIWSTVFKNIILLVRELSSLLLDISRRARPGARHEVGNS